MKKILLATLIFLLPIHAFAQKAISVGFNVGVMPYTVPLNNKSNFNSAFSMGTQDPSLYLSANVLYTFHEKYQLGLQVAAGNITYKVNYSKLNFTLYNYYVHNNGGRISFGSPENVANPAIPVTLLFNKILNDNAVSCYAGVEAGYERFVVSSSEGSSMSVVLGGAHFGATYDMSRAVKLNANIAVDYHYSYSGNVHYKILSFPLTVGLVF